MILLIDNYDSFSYNLYQLIGEIRPDLKVIRNDEKTIEEIRKLKPDAIVLSPGPGRPEDAGICISVVKELGAEIPILGVCLGHQSICAAYGGEITYAKKLMHGKTSELVVEEDNKLFQGIDQPIQIGRYHSLAAKEETLPEELKVTARTVDGEIMAVEHRTNPVYGLQFHLESILTPEGKKMLENFFSADREIK